MTKWIHDIRYPHSYSAKENLLSADSGRDFVPVLKRIVFSGLYESKRNIRLSELTEDQSGLIIKAAAHCHDAFVSRRTLNHPLAHEQEQAWRISSNYLIASLGRFEMSHFKVHLRCAASTPDAPGRVLRQVIDIALLHRLAIFYSESSTLADRAGSVGDLESLVKAMSEPWEESLISYAEVLKKDPSGVYPRMDWPSKTTYWDRIGYIATSLGINESSIATMSLNLAQRSGDDHPHHIGHYLFDDGLGELCSAFGKPNECSDRRLATTAVGKYLLLQVFLTALFAALLGAVVDFGAQRFFLVYLALISVIAADSLKGSVELILGLVSERRRCLVVNYVTEGLPEAVNVVIAVPMHLVDDAQWSKALAVACWNLKQSNDTNVSLVFLTDFPDSDGPGDSHRERALLDKAIRDVESCPGLLEGQKLDIHLLHRERQFVENEECWMGVERKRGKLRSLHKLILDGTDDFSVASEKARLICRAAKYVLCLDEDSRLTRNSVQRMAGFLDHPMNSPRRLRDKEYVGHGIVVPCVMTDRDSAISFWRWPRFTVGPTADPRSPAAVRRSTIYDWFGQVPYSGKGMYSPKNFEDLCGARIPDGIILSHDTIEAAWLRPGYMDGALITDAHPSSLRSFIERQERWIRGDLQNAAVVMRDLFIADKRPPLLTYFTIGNQLLAWTGNAAIFIVITCLIASNAHTSWYVFGFLAMLLGGYQRLLSNFYYDRKLLPSEIIRIYIPYITRIHLAQLLRLASAPLHALLLVRAFYLTCVRLVLRRRLLQWRSAAIADAHQGRIGLFSVLSWIVSISAAIGFFAAFNAKHNVLALAILFIWVLSPLLDAALTRSPRDGN